MLKSSIIGKDFINYRKTTLKNERLLFSNSVRQKGIGCIPIVIDSVDKEISDAISKKERRQVLYGKELTLHMDKTINDVLREVKILLIQNDKEDLVKNNTLNIGLEDGSLLLTGADLGSLYKEYRNKEDKILYLLITKETTIYGYVTSIVNYLVNNVTNFLSFTYDKINNKNK